ncbi:unnamed protein product [Protopolystoma xenopodis]|uniref:Uncharacterized protein n=1 Tax=Protopolystoma xenopodis TaxID=117903 RepID=A0A3S5B5D9_9PLAT|nr:unnamed protein product [Protopolystoma xenopodis]
MGKGEGSYGVVLQQDGILVSRGGGEKEGGRRLDHRSKAQPQSAVPIDIANPEPPRAALSSLSSYPLAPSPPSLAPGLGP